MKRTIVTVLVAALLIAALPMTVWAGGRGIHRRGVHPNTRQSTWNETTANVGGHHRNGCARGWGGPMQRAGLCSVFWGAEGVDADALVAEREVFLAALVSAGLITQAQADDDLVWYREMLEARDSLDWQYGGFRCGGYAWCRR